MAEVTGRQAYFEACKRIRDDGLAAIKGVNIDQAQRVLEDARKRVPVKTGALRDSGRLSKTKTGANITFGGKGAPYAVYVHNLPNRHESGQSFFLTSAQAEAIQPTGAAWQSAFLRVIDNQAR